MPPEDHRGIEVKAELKILDRERYENIRKFHRKLRIDWLVDNGFLKPTQNPYLTRYQKNEFGNAFIGQYNPEDDQPEGIVRIIMESGNVYEGGYAHGRRQGFGVNYFNDLIFIGWYRDGVTIGNYIDLSASDLSLHGEGWAEEFQRRGPRKEDLVYKNFEVKDIFDNNFYHTEYQTKPPAVEKKPAGKAEAKK